MSLGDWLKYQWNKLDDDYIKPYLLYNWPHSKKEHEELALKVKHVFIEYQISKYPHISSPEKNNKELYVPLDGERDNIIERIDIELENQN